MKKTIIGLALAIIMVVSILTIMLPTTAAPEEARGINNGGFEKGLTGWTVVRPYGYYGSAGVHTYYYLSYNQYRYIYPVDGDYFARVTGGHYSLWTSLRQTFYANAGETLTGWAAFKMTDYLPYNDNAAVNIYTSMGWQIAQPWYRSGSMVGSYGFSDWAEWKWSAPASGTYILELAARNNRDTAIAPHGFFDMESGIPASVEFEPQSLNLDSNGNYVQTKVVGFPENPEYTPYDVVPGSCEIAGIGVETKFDTANNNKFITKADRLLVEDAIGAPGEEVEVVINGNLQDGTNFAGSAFIKAILN
jgi:hypothetical protein